MTLKEFVKNFMEVNNITTSVDEMIRKINDYARSQATAGVACLSEEQVEEVILGKVKVPERVPSVAKEKADEAEKKETAAKKENLEKNKKVLMWHQKAPTFEVNGEKMEQMDLFGDVSL